MPLKSGLGSVAMFLRRHVLAIVLVVCVGHLCWLMRTVADTGPARAEFELRNPDFPRTHIARIHLDLTSPNHFVTLTWIGPAAAQQPTGPFRSSPGAGWGSNDCNDAVESNCPD